jgi:hypothetical protein
MRMREPKKLRKNESHFPDSAAELLLQNQEGAL